MDKKAFEAQKKFIESFSERVNDKVACLEMAELKASSAALKAMGLSLRGAAEGIWGLVIVCQKSLYFYAPPRELLLMSMIRAGAENAKVEEQICCFSNLSDLKFFASPKKWYQIFSTNKIEFSFLSEEQRFSGEFSVSKNAVEILAKIRAVLN